MVLVDIRALIITIEISVCEPVVNVSMQAAGHHSSGERKAGKKDQQPRPMTRVLYRGVSAMQATESVTLFRHHPFRIVTSSINTL